MALLTAASQVWAGSAVESQSSLPEGIAPRNCETERLRRRSRASGPNQLRGGPGRG